MSGKQSTVAEQNFELLQTVKTDLCQLRKDHDSLLLLVRELIEHLRHTDPSGWCVLTSNEKYDID